MHCSEDAALPAVGSAITLRNLNPESAPLAGIIVTVNSDIEGHAIHVTWDQDTEHSQTSLSRLVVMAEENTHWTLVLS